MPTLQSPARGQRSAQGVDSDDDHASNRPARQCSVLGSRHGTRTFGTAPADLTQVSVAVELTDVKLCHEWRDASSPRRAHSRTSSPCPSARCASSTWTRWVAEAHPTGTAVQVLHLHIVGAARCTWIRASVPGTSSNLRPSLQCHRGSPLCPPEASPGRLHWPPAPGGAQCFPSLA